MYLNVWYYIVVGEGESLPYGTPPPKIYHLLKGNLIPVRAFDFSAVKTGDIILDAHSYSLDLNLLGSLEYCYTKYIVMSTNNVDSLVMVDTSHMTIVQPLLVTKSGDSLVWESLDGHFAPETMPLERLHHFTPEEFEQERIDERIAAQSTLAHFLSYWNDAEVTFPQAVSKAAAKVLAEKTDDYLSNLNVANLESAYKVMGEVIAAGEKVYRETIAENLVGMNELIQQAKDASAKIATITQSLKPWRNDGEAVTVIHPYMEDGYRGPDRRNTFRAGTGVLTDSGDAYFIERVTKSRAHLSDPKTGEKVGYLARRKSEGVVLKLEDGSVETLGRSYDVIPANTPEDVLAYEAAYVEAYRIISTLYSLIDVKRPVLEGFNAEHTPLSLLRNLASVQIAVIRTVSDLESEKNRVLEGMEANIEKMKRLHEQAYGK